VGVAAAPPGDHARHGDRSAPGRRGRTGRAGARLAAAGGRLRQPAADAPAVVVVVDEYAELPAEALSTADSVARRGRAVAVTLLVATQRRRRGDGHGASGRRWTSASACVCGKRRDADLILGQGMHAPAGDRRHSTRPASC